ncbi:MAG: sugar phosphate isomerase/epimerase family protein [Polyangiaceae bacterium]
MFKSVIGVIQGRLSPRPADRLQAFPVDCWWKEFEAAAELGIPAIEWIVEADSWNENPLLFPGGNELVRRVSESTGVQVRSICADHVMVHKIAGVGESERRQNVAAFQHIIGAAAQVGARRILVPLLETSALETEAQKEQARRSLREAGEMARACGIVLGLEMDIPGHAYAAFIRSVAHPAVRAYYDTGNSGAQGYDIATDVVPLLPMLEAVHVKDRELHGGSRMLGEGAANLRGFLQTLAAANFHGDFTLQSWFGDDPRGEIQRNYAYFLGLYSGAFLKAA